MLGYHFLPCPLHLCRAGALNSIHLSDCSRPPGDIRGPPKANCFRCIAWPYLNQRCVFFSSKRQNKQRFSQQKEPAKVCSYDQWIVLAFFGKLCGTAPYKNIISDGKIPMVSGEDFPNNTNPSGKTIWQSIQFDELQTWSSAWSPGEIPGGSETGKGCDEWWEK